jgi:hypothetical protein
MERRGTNSPTAEGIQIAEIACQDIANRFCYAAGITYREFVTDGITVNTHSYLDVMEHLYARMHHVRCEQLRNYSWCCCTTSHLVTARFLKQFLAATLMCVIQRSRNRHIWHRQTFSPPEGETGAKWRTFQ